MKKSDGKKLYKVLKYVMARTASEAIKKSIHAAPDEAWVDDDWKKNNDQNPGRLESAIEFEN